MEYLLPFTAVFFSLLWSRRRYRIHQANTEAQEELQPCLSVFLLVCVSVGMVLLSSLSWFPAQPLLPVCTAITSFPSPDLPHPPAHLSQIQLIRHSLYIPVMCLCSLSDRQFSFVSSFVLVFPCCLCFLDLNLPVSHYWNTTFQLLCPTCLCVLHWVHPVPPPLK